MHTNAASSLNQCIQKLTWALESLNAVVHHSVALDISSLIIQAMSGPWRHYHTPQHVFELCNSDDPIEVLAALFHDIVYVQVDGHIHLNLSLYLAPYIKQTGRKIVLRQAGDMPKNLEVDIVMSIFGVCPGDDLLPHMGQNEFLSALVAARILKPLLPLSQIAEVVTCIEATIPFRAPEAEGITAIASLQHRLTETSDRFALTLSAQEIETTMLRAVRLANRDLSGFATPSPAIFLDNTWSLLPEFNHALKNQFSYTVRDYRMALHKMEVFLNYLSPHDIFHQFQAEPTDEIYRKWIETANYNLSVGRLYIGSKLVSIAILEALAARYGLNTQLSTFMGDLPSGSVCPPRLSDFLPTVPKPYQPRTDVERDVMVFLEVGRHRDTDYDVPNSPLSTFLVKELGFQEMQRQLQDAKRFFQGELSSEHFLLGFRSDLIAIITYAIFELMKTRLRSLIFGAGAIQKA